MMRRTARFGGPAIVLIVVMVGMNAWGGCDDTSLVPPPVANPFNPRPESDPLTVDAGADLVATEEDTLTLTAVASGGSPPYSYRWNLEQVPDDPDDPFDGGLLVIPDGLQAEIEATDFTIGRYIYRVRVTDVVGRVAVDFVVIDVGPTQLVATVAEVEREDDVLMASSAVPFTLTAQTNLTGDFSYSWSQLSGPDVMISDPSEDTTEVTAIEPGDVAIQLRVRDLDTGVLSTFQVNVTVEQGDAFLVVVDQPDLLLLDEFGTFTADITNPTVNADSLSYTWEVTNGVDATILSPNERTTEIAGHLLDTVVVRVTASGLVNGSLQEASEDVEIVVLRDLAPRFSMFVTSSNEGATGLIEFEFDAEATPKTVANIVRYMDDGFFSGILWHRLALTDTDPFVAQFGGFRRDGEDLIREEPTRDPVESEADSSLGNTARNVAMALVGGDVNSGTTQVFVNMQDNDFLDDQGFTAFGRVTDGFEIIEAMFNAETGTETPDGGPSLSDVPVDDITIGFFRRQDVITVDRVTGAKVGSRDDANR